MIPYERAWISYVVQSLSKEVGEQNEMWYGSLSSYTLSYQIYSMPANPRRVQPHMILSWFDILLAQLSLNDMYGLEFYYAVDIHGSLVFNQITQKAFAVSVRMFVVYTRAHLVTVQTRIGKARVTVHEQSKYIVFLECGYWVTSHTLELLPHKVC